MEDKTVFRLFGAWFVFCAIAAVAGMVGIGYLVYALIDFLGRH